MCLWYSPAPDEKPGFEIDNITQITQIERYEIDNNVINNIVLPTFDLNHDGEVDLDEFYNIFERVDEMIELVMIGPR